MSIRASSGGGSSGVAYKNTIINGGFRVNQRAVSGTVTLGAGVYGHDRWKAGAGGCTYTFATTNNVTTLTITAGTLQQVIEGASLLSGTYVLSWTGTATARIDSGSYSASGVTGTSVGGTNQTIEFGTGTVTSIQYELGASATSTEFRPIGLELQLCQRYFVRLTAGGGGGNFGYGVINNTTTGYVAIPLPVQMRVAPTAFNVSGAISTSNMTYGSASLNSQGTTPFAVSVLISGSSGVAGAFINLSANSDVNAYVQMSAEL